MKYNIFSTFTLVLGRFYSWIRIRIFPDRIRIFGRSGFVLRKKSDPGEKTRIQNTTWKARTVGWLGWKGFYQQTEEILSPHTDPPDRGISSKDVQVLRREEDKLHQNYHSFNVEKFTNVNNMDSWWSFQVFSWGLGGRGGGGEETKRGGGNVGR